MSSQELDSELDQVRCHMGSSLPSQRAPAVLLSALESTFSSEATARTPVAYFAALTTTVGQLLKRESSPSTEDGALLPSALYLLSIVLRHVPTPVIRSHVSTILEAMIPLFPILSSHPGSLCSLLAIFSTVFPALELTQLSVHTLRRAFVSLLELALDNQQKVRRKAQDTIHTILSNPPPPVVKHPYLGQTASYVLEVLSAVANRSISKKVEGAVDAGISCCGFLNAIADNWPEEQVAPLVRNLLLLPGLLSPLLTTQAFRVLSALLRSPNFSSSSTTITSILDVILQNPPPESAHGVAEAWLEAVGNTMVIFARSDAPGCLENLIPVWEKIWLWLKSPAVSVRIATESTLGTILRYCIPSSAIEVAIEAALIGDPESLELTEVGRIVDLLETSFDVLAFAEALPHLLYVLSRLISRLRHRTTIPSSFEPRPITAAEVLASDMIQYVAEKRMHPKFEYRERADDVLSAAIEVIGPAAFLDILPLNILPSDLGQNPGQGRAFLLPILGSSITNTSLQHFVEYFLPLSSTIYELKTKADYDGKLVESKIWETCIEQIWSCFKGYCEACIDVPDAFQPSFFQLLASLLNTQALLRTPIFNGLRTLVQTTKSLATSTTPEDQMFGTFGITCQQAKESLIYLKRMTGETLLVLFNVYCMMPPETKSTAAEVIVQWLGIAEPQEIDIVFNKVVEIFKQNMTEAPSPVSLGNAHSMLEILNLMVPLLNSVTCQQLFDYVSDPREGLLENRDPVVQKKAYRILGTVLEETHSVAPFSFVAIFRRTEELTSTVLPGVKPDRLRFIRETLNKLPTSQVHQVNVVLPEIVLATKEFNEKSRVEAFDCLVIIGRKLKGDGSVRVSSSLGPHHDGSNGIEDYLKIIASGMAGDSPHMISASVTAVSRVLFEFKGSVSLSMQSEITKTVTVFASSENREVAKSAFGYLKVAIVSLPQSVIRPQFREIVPVLLSRSHDQKNPFKSSVLRIFSQMIKRYGFDEVQSSAVNGEDTKILNYVRKRSERARKKRSAREAREDDPESDGPLPKSSTGNAFEDVLYGSDSDDSDAEGGQDIKHKSQETQTTKATKAKLREPRLRVDDGAPLDLMYGAPYAITALPPTKRRKPGQEANRFQVDEGTGRIMFHEEEADQKGGTNHRPMRDAVDGEAYMEQLISADGFSRTATGAVKFHKDTKKRRAMEMDDGDEGETKSVSLRDVKARRPRVVKLGREFKAKNAGGDVKKPGQQDPFAYLTLREMAGKKKGPKVRYSITGRN